MLQSFPICKSKMVAGKKSERIHKNLSKAGKKKNCIVFDSKENNLVLEFVENCETEETCSFDLAMAMCSEFVLRPSQRVQVNLQED